MIDATLFHKLADSLLQELADKIEDFDSAADAEYLQGILNIELGDGRKYVINKHEPTRQIWLSSPLSGAHKFSFDETKKTWESTKKEFLEKILKEEIFI